VDTLVLLLTLKEMDSVFPHLGMMLTIGLTFIPFIMLRYIPSIPSFFSAFYHERMLTSVKTFSASIEMIIQFLSLILHISCIMFIDLCST
jgi:hypothetical protein